MNMRVFAAVAVAFSLGAAVPVAAQPVEYVRVCDQYGVGWIFIPGTNVCANPNTGETREETEFGTAYGLLQTQQEAAENHKKALEGVALSLALPNASIDPGKSFGAAVNVGTFGGEGAIGFAGAFRAAEGLTVNGAVGAGFSGNTVGGRAGVNFSW